MESVMEFKEFVSIKEEEFKGVKVKEVKGSRERDDRDGESVFSDKVNMLANTPYINKMAGDFGKYFKSMKDSAMGDDIARLELDSHIKGSKGLAYIFARMLNHILFDSNGNRYDLSRTSDMGESKSKLQNINPLFGSLFMLGKDILAGGKPDEKKMSKFIAGLRDIADTNDTKNVLGLYKMGKELETVQFPNLFTNDQIQDTFKAFHTKGAGTKGLSSILNVPDEEFEEVYLNASQMPKEISKYPAVVSFSHRLIKATKATRGDSNKVGFREAIPEQDAVVDSIASQISSSKAIDNDMVDAIFHAIKLYGVGDPGPVSRPDFSEAVISKFGRPFFDAMYDKYDLEKVVLPSSKEAILVE